MTVIAGIDEAGLGPNLGPLVVSGVALKMADNDCTESRPWEIFSEIISDSYSKKEKHISVCDSKLIYTKGKIPAIEKTVFPFFRLRNPDITSSIGKAEFLKALSLPECNEYLANILSQPWYKADSQFELQNSQEDYATLSESFRDKNSSLDYLYSTVVSAGKFNSIIDSGLNKSELVMSQTGCHIENIAENFPQDNIAITVDKQGGRNFYLPFLTGLFPGAWIDIIEEGANSSIYKIKRDESFITITFKPKADSSAFCVALASIFSKYIRERFMEELNSFFAEKIPGLKPTAGYPGDAPRFIEDISGVISDLKINRDALIRKR